jgi:hypothetical protein
MSKNKSEELKNEYARLSFKVQGHQKVVYTPQFS